MKKKEQKIQLILISIGLFLIMLTYFYFPKKSIDKTSENETVRKEVQDPSIDGEGPFSAFENVVYEGLYDLDKPFSIQSKKAYVLDSEPNLVYMTDMHVTLYLKDGRVVDIVSDRGRYNKNTHDCFFEENVKITDNETKIFSDNLDLLATKNFAKAYNKVRLNHPTGFLRADQIDYDFEKKYFKVSMFDEKVVKMKVVQ